MVVLPFNTSVELVLQGTNIQGAESHPLHIHGFNFFVVGQGFGNFNPAKDPANFNLVDPVERNTIGVPMGGWAAVRFFADNPGKIKFPFYLFVSIIPFFFFFEYISNTHKMLTLNQQY